MREEMSLDSINPGPGSVGAEYLPDRRFERAVFETDRQIVVGDVTLPPEGYQSRFSDVLNRPDQEFVPLTNVEITSLVDGTVKERPFLALSKAHVRVSYPFAPESGGAPQLG
jgi:hypothetical protein